MALQPLYGKPSSKNYINPPRVLDNAEEFMGINDTIRAFMEQAEKMAKNLQKEKTLYKWRDRGQSLPWRTDESFKLFQLRQGPPLQ